MKKHLTLVLMTVCLLSLSSCGNTFVNIFFNSDNSGTYTFAIDFSIVGKMMGPSGRQQFIDEYKNDPNGYTKKLSFSQSGNSIKGVSNFKQELDEETLQLKYSFNFENIAALNEALIKEFKFKDTVTSTITLTDQPYFKTSKKGLERTPRELFPFDLSTASEEDEESKQMQEMLEMFNRDTYFQVTYEFEKTIKSFNNKEYKQTGDHKLEWRRFYYAEEDAEKKLAVSIKLK